MLGGFLYGFDIGATSFVLAMLLEPTEHHHHVWWRQFSSIQQGLFVSGLSLGALLGSHLILHYLSNKIGRRMELRLCAIFYLVGTCLNVLSGTVLRETSYGFYSLFLGRLVFGMGVGFIMHGVSQVDKK
jgi:MFS family permease